MATKKGKMPPTMFMRGPATAQPGIEKLLLPYFQNRLTNVRQILVLLRKRMTDDEIVEHVRILEEDQWFELGINYTLVSKIPPLPPAIELVAMKGHLVELGLNPRQAILLITMINRAVFETGDELKTKLDIAFDGHALQASASKYEITTLNTLLKTPVEKLQAIRRRMQEEEIEHDIWIPTLFRYVRQRPKTEKQKPS